MLGGGFDGGNGRGGGGDDGGGRVVSTDLEDPEELFLGCAIIGLIAL
jgi:hypothetical protein